MIVAIITRREPSARDLRLFVPARGVGAFRSSYSGNCEVPLAAFPLCTIRGKRRFLTPWFLFDYCVSVKGAPCNSRSSLWETSFRLSAVAVSIAMGSGSPIKLGWKLHPKYVPPGGSIASDLVGEMEPFDESGALFSPGYAYDHRRVRARVPLSLRGISITYEVELYRPCAVRCFEANLSSDFPAEITRSAKRNRRGAWLPGWVQLPITPSSETSTVGKCDMPFVRCRGESRYQPRIQGMVSDFDRVLVHLGAAFPPNGHKILGLMAFEHTVRPVILDARSRVVGRQRG